MVNSTHISTRRRLLALATGVATLAATLLLTPTAVAAPPPVPQGLSPKDDTITTTIPTLSWQRASEATRYDVQVSANLNFNPVLWQTPLSGTVNTHAVPTNQLPKGLLYWRVKSRNGTNESSSWSPPARFDRRAVGAPYLISPAPDSKLVQPSQPPLLRWEPVPGAKSYRISISADELFTDPAKTKSYTSKSPSYVVPDPALATTYYWKVRADLGGGLLSDESEVRSYSIAGLTPAQVPDALESAETTLVDAVLDWDPVDGAKTYNLQVDTNINFSSPEIDVNGITGTSYARPKTLNNDQYYWRVQPVDVLGNELDWSSTSSWRFRRHWPNQPDLEHPVAGEIVRKALYFEWTAVKHASAYTLQLSRSSTFSSIESSCTTSNTTYTPGAKVTPGSTDCWPVEGSMYYWRVIAHDGFVTPDPDHPVTDGIVAEIGRFTYEPDLVSPISPADGSMTSLPILKWEPLAGTARYKVTLTPENGGAAITETTSATSFTPRNRLTVGASYRWMVQAVREDGRIGAGWTVTGQPRFTVSAAADATAATPEPLTPPVTGTRFPNLTWTAVAGATDYRLLVRPSGSSAWTYVQANGQPARFGYSAGEDHTSTFLEPNTYEWMIEAWNGSAILSDSAERGSFTIEPPRPVSGHTVALRGQDLSSSDESARCGSSLPNECEKLRQTPVLRWGASSDAGYYKIHVYKDREMTNRAFPTVTVTNTHWTPTVPLQDSQAGSAYFWHVQPCTSEGHCAPLAHAAHAFNKESLGVRLESPADNAVLADDIKFSWRDFLDTQDEQTAEELGESAIDVPARVEARWYQVQVSADSNFQSLLEDVKVDQMSFTSFDTTYPEGPLYWRVRAIQGYDSLGDEVRLRWSAPRTFLKRSGSPEGLNPASPGADSGAPLQWEPMPFAASYDVEVYRNGDTQAQDANKVLSENSRQVAFTPTNPLPVGEGEYAWRVRRVDAKTRKGEWSGWAKFTISVGPPILSTPISGETVPPQDGVFTWGQHETATSYRFERRQTGSSSIAESIGTDALAYAPTTSISGGNWQWRVTALDSEGATLRASEWRDFVVVDRPQAIALPKIEGDGSVGSPLTTVDPQWDRPGVVNHYVWLKNGFPITGETGRTYVVKSSDYSSTSPTQISIKVTGSLPGYESANVTSEQVTVILGNRLLPETLPTIEGSGKVGSTVTKTGDVTWTDGNGTAAGVTTSYAWYRGDTRVQFGSSPYTVRAVDLGQEITLRATGTKYSYGDGHASSTSIRAALGDPPVATTSPSVTGTPTVGQTLFARTGAWEPAFGNSYHFEWLRNGSPIAGASGTSYRVEAPDAGRVLAIRVTARREGYQDGISTSQSVTVSKIASSSAARLSTSRTSPRRRVRMFVKIVASGISSPTGTVRVKQGRKSIKKVSLGADKAGRITIRLPRLRRGTYRLQAAYSGNSQVKGSRSGRVRLVVR